MRHQDGSGILPTYYDGFEYGGHDPGYEADLEKFVREAEAARFVRQPGEPLWQFSQRIDGELKLSMAELNQAERVRETEPLPRVLEPEQSAEPAPPPAKLPDGTPHPNPLLAERGWQAQGGWYVRQREADREPGA